MSTQLVKRRKVFYISGFDPKGAGGYYDLYLDEAARQAALSGMTINVGRRQRKGRLVAEWHIAAREDGHEVTTDYSFLKWDDIIRAHWPRGPFRLLGLTLMNYASYIRSGVLRRVLANSWPTFICGSLPTAAMLATLLVSLLIGGLAGVTVTALTGWPAWIAALIMLPVAGELYRRLIVLIDNRIEMHWIARIYLFSLLQSAQTVKNYEDRIEKFGEIVAEAAKSDEFDELLIIGHSTGAQTAVSVLARALKHDPDLGRHRSKLSFLTIGGSIPMLSWQPDAGWFCEELQTVAACPDLDWLDFTAAQDGACFPLHDPVASSGLIHPEGQDPKPKLLSIKLFDLFTPARFAEIRHSWGRVHFQCLMAGEQQADYDFFAITAGARTLAARYAERPSAAGFDRFKIKWLGN